MDFGVEHGASGKRTPLVVIVGPTAVGKSALALAIARKFDAAIVSADSRQVYRYMDVGTAKPSREEQATVRHFMIDLVEPSDVYSAGAYVREAGRVLDRILSEGRVALVVGGTGFYIRGLLDGAQYPAVAPNPGLRADLRRAAESDGKDALHQRLKELDPRSADRIHPNNLPRVIRALEVVQALGGPVPDTRASGRPALWLGLRLPLHELDRIADRRALDQMASGLLDETRLLLAMGYDPASPALSGFGYRELVRHLRGELTREAAVAAYQQATRQYIRRQMTWFRRDARIHWLDGSDRVEAACRAIEAFALTGVSEWS